MNLLTRDTHALATPAGRLPGTDGHAAAREYLRGRFDELDLAPQWHRFDISPGLQGHNLVGVIPGGDRSLAPILLGAHYDSVIPAPCADDNAAAVAVMLSVAGQIPADSLERDVLIVAFDTEEPPNFISPTMGSTRFVEDFLSRPVHVAIIMDLVGHAAGVGDPDLMCVTGVESHPALVGVVVDLDLPTVPVNNARIGDRSDHHAFREAGMPFLFLTVGEWRHYHDRTDTPDRIDYPKMARLVGDLLTMIGRADAAQMDGARSHDISGLEEASMLRHLGPTLAAMGVASVDSAAPQLRSALGRSCRCCTRN